MIDPKSKLEINGKVKVKSEKQTRNAVLTLARESGVEEQAIKILNRYDSAMKNTHDPGQKLILAKMGNAEIHKLLGLQGPCVVNGEEILPGRPGWENEIEKEKGIIKLD